MKNLALALLTTILLAGCGGIPTRSVEYTKVCDPNCRYVAIVTEQPVQTSTVTTTTVTYGQLQTTTTVFQTAPASTIVMYGQPMPAFYGPSLYYGPIGPCCVGGWRRDGKWWRW